MRNKCVVCAIAKYEYDYIREWVEHNLSLGFDQIYIYDNNDVDGESYDELLSDYINEGKVVIRDVRGMTSMQRVVYFEFYHNDDFDWAAFIDIDEFIVLNNDKFKSIKDLTNLNEETDGYFLFWETIGDSDRLYMDTNKSILENYDKPSDFRVIIDNAVAFQNRWGKSILRKGLPVVGMHEHFVYSCEGDYKFKYSDSLGNFTYIYDYNIDDEKEQYIKSTYNSAYIKHIYTKSLTDYINHKVKRRAANSNNILHTIDKYFTINEITQEKVDLLKDLGYKPKFIFSPDTLVVIEVVNNEQCKKLIPYFENIQNLCNTRVIIKLQEYSNDLDIGSLANQNEFYYYSHQWGDDIQELNRLFFEYSSYVNQCKALIHIGISRDDDFNDDYINDYIEPLFRDLESNMRYLFESMSDGGDILLTSKKNYVDSIDFYNNNSQYKKDVMSCCDKLGVNLPHLNLKHNIFIARTETLKPYLQNDKLKFKFNYGDQYEIINGVWCSSDYHLFKQVFYGLFNDYRYVS